MSAVAVNPHSVRSRLSPWLETALAQLCEGAGSGLAYLGGGQPAAEPTALAALALAGNGRSADAQKAAAWLAQQQLLDGSVAVRPGENKPAWPTSLALVVWQQLNQDRHFDTAIAKATAWLLAAHGTGSERNEEVGHDTTLIGWSWAENTHSWLEPTAFAVLALSALGKREHARAKEAIRLMENRLLDSGGCNYGNTTVFGRELRAHVQPTGIVLLALAGGPPSAKAQKSIDWLASQLGPQTPPASLAWGLLGLRAQGVVPAASADWLAVAAERVHHRYHSPAKLALLALANVGWPGVPALITSAEALRK